MYKEEKGTDRKEVIETVKTYILDEFLVGENPEALTPDTPLIKSGVLDSIATLKLVAFLEEHYGVEFQAHEMSPDYLDTLSDIAHTVESKQAES